MKNKISQRVNKIKESPIRKIFSLAAANRGEFINLSIGQAHFKTSLKLKKSAQKAIEHDCNFYEQTAGNILLRKKIAEKLNKKNKIKASYENILISSGVSGGIFLALSSLINEKDEVIITDPLFTMYEQILNFLGAKILYHDTYPDFRLNPEKLKKLISKKTKLIIINSPNNPTGMVYDKLELTKLAEIADKYKTLILSDEIYEVFDYNKKFLSIGSIYQNTITLNGFSKSHSIPGWRLGYVHAPNEIIEAMKKLQQYTFVCAPSFAQQAIISEINADLSSQVAEYKKNSEFIYKKMSNDFNLQKPEGAFYAFIKLPKNKKFIENAIKNKVLIVPGSAFSRKNTHFRISFATDLNTLEKGIEILKKIELK